MPQYIKDVADAVRLKRYYRGTFQSDPGRRVLRDLAKVCHAVESTADPDPREQARKEGKRQVWLRIQRMMNVDEAEIFALINEGENQ